MMSVHHHDMLEDVLALLDLDLEGLIANRGTTTTGSVIGRPHSVAVGVFACETTKHAPPANIAELLYLYFLLGGLM